MDRRFILIVVALFLLVFMGTFWFLQEEENPSGMASPAMIEGEAADPDVYFKDCTEVREAGRAPLLAGQPGYREELDPDGTGLACPPLE